MSRRSRANAQWIAQTTSNVIASSCTTQLTTELSSASDAADVLQFELLKRERVMLPSDDDAIRRSSNLENILAGLTDKNTLRPRSTTPNPTRTLRPLVAALLSDTWYDRWHTSALTYGRVRHTSLINQVTFAFEDGNFAACKTNSSIDTEVRCISTEIQSGDSKIRLRNEANETLQPVILNMYSRINGTQLSIQSDYIVDINLREQIWYTEIANISANHPLDSAMQSKVVVSNTPQKYQKSWTSLHFSPQNHRVALVLSFSLFNRSNAFLGVGAFEVRFEQLNNFIKTIRPTPGSELILLDHHRKIIASTAVAKKHYFTSRLVPADYVLTAQDLENRCVFSSFDLEDFAWGNANATLSSSGRTTTMSPQADETRELYCQMSMLQLGLPFLNYFISHYPHLLPNTDHADHHSAHSYVSSYGTEFETESEQMQSAGTRRLMLNGKAMWTSVVTVNPTEWTIILFVPEEELLGGLLYATMTMIIVGCCSIVVTLLLTTILLKLVMRPVLAIAQKMVNASYLSQDIDCDDGSEEMTELGNNDGPLDDMEVSKTPQKKAKILRGPPNFSMLWDVAILQSAYWTMVKEIQTLRSYVPSHVCDEIVTVAATKHKNYQNSAGDTHQRNRSNSSKQKYAPTGTSDSTDCAAVCTNCILNHSTVLSASTTDENTLTNVHGKIPIVRVAMTNKNIPKDGSQFMFEEELHHQGLRSVDDITANNNLPKDACTTANMNRAKENFSQADIETHNNTCLTNSNKVTTSNAIDSAIVIDRNFGMGLQLFSADPSGRLQYEESLSPMLSLCSAHPTVLKKSNNVPETGHVCSVPIGSNLTTDDGVSIMAPSEFAANLLARRSLHADKGGPAGHKLVERNVTIAVVNIVDFHSFAWETECTAEVLKHHEAAVAFIQSAASRCGGVLDTFNGDKFWVSFNATTKCENSVIAAVCFGLEVSRGMNNLSHQTDPHTNSIKTEDSGKIVTNRKKLSTSGGNHPHTAHQQQGIHRLLSNLGGATIGIATGRALVGPMGTKTIKRHTIISNAITEAAALERQANKYPDSAVVVAGDIIPLIEGYFKYLIIDACALPGSGGKRRRIASVKGLMCAEGCNPLLFRGINLSAYECVKTTLPPTSPTTTNSNSNKNNDNTKVESAPNLPTFALPKNTLPTKNPYQATNEFFNSFLEGRLDECVKLMREIDAAAGASQAYWALIKRKEEEREQKQKELRKQSQANHHSFNNESSSNALTPPSCASTAPMMSDSQMEAEENIIVPPAMLYQPQECDNIAVMLQFVWSLLAQRPPIDGRKYQSPFGASYA